MITSILTFLSHFNKGIFIEINEHGKCMDAIINDNDYDCFNETLSTAEKIVSLIHFKNNITFSELIYKAQNTTEKICEPITLIHDQLFFCSTLKITQHPIQSNHFIIIIESIDIIGFNELFSNLPIASYLHSFEGSIIKANPKFFQLLHRESHIPFVSSIEFMNSDDFINEMQTKENCNIQQLSIYTHQLELNDGQKNKVPVIIHTLKITASAYYISFVIDLSQQKQQVQILQEMNENKSKALAVIAHDLRAPIAQIQGLSEILLKSYRDITEEHRKFMLNEIKVGTKRTQDLLSNVLNWGKSQMKEVNPTEDTIQLFQLVNTVLKLYASSLDSKQIRTTNSIDPSIEIIVDANILNTVIRNVLSNAIKFTPVNGSINIYFSKNDDEYIVHIYNSGDGIKEEVVPYLFTVNAKNISTGTNHEKGTGIGLYICKELLKKINGNIWLSTNTPNGTTFSFSLPNNNNQKSTSNLSIDYQKMIHGSKN